MMNTIIKQRGIGFGSDNTAAIHDRKTVEKFIEGLSDSDIYKIALDARTFQYTKGLAVVYINEESLKLSSLAFSQGECNQACDNNYITLFEIGQNSEEIDYFVDSDYDDYLDCYLLEREDIKKFYKLECSNLDNFDAVEKIEANFDCSEERAERISNALSSIEIELNYESELDEIYE